VEVFAHDAQLEGLPARRGVAPVPELCRPPAGSDGIRRLHVESVDLFVGHILIQEIGPLVHEGFVGVLTAAPDTSKLYYRGNKDSENMRTQDKNRATLRSLSAEEYKVVWEIE
jgi:hypothetical protein